MPESTTSPLSFLAGLREPLDHEGRLESNLPCRKCGYNLRGHTAADTCPECGAPVAVSLRYFLQYSSRRWVAALASGADALSLGVLATILSSVCIAIAGFLPGDHLRWAVGFATGGVAMLASGVLFIVGLWYLTAPEPLRRGRPKPKAGAKARRYEFTWIRLLLRIALAATFIVPLFWGVASSELGMAPARTDLIGLTLIALCGVLTATLLWLHFAALMRRIPSAGLVRLAQLTIAATLLTAGVLVAGAFSLSAGLSLGRAITFGGGQVRWHLGGDAPTGPSAAGGGVTLATIESEVLPGTTTRGSPQQPGAVTVWTRTTLSLPRLLVAAATLPPLAMVLCGAALILQSRAALRRAALQAERGA